MNNSALRVAALQQAIEYQDKISKLDDGLDALLDIYSRFYALFRGPASLITKIGAIHKQNENAPNNDFHRGDEMQLHDDEQVRLTVDAKDAKGYPTLEQLTWTVDNDTVARLEVSADTQSVLVVAGQPGSAVVRVEEHTDGEETPLFATVAVDVVAGDIALIGVTEGAPEKQPTV